MNPAASPTLVHDAPAAADILSFLPTPVLLIDPDGRIAQANIAAESLFNTSQAALREKGWDALLSADSPFRALLADAQSGEGNFAAYDLDLHLIGGVRFRADVLIAPIGYQAGWLTVAFQTRAVASLVDRQLVHQGAARSAVGVAAMLAHEIKNPLSGIRGAAQLLAHNVDEDGRELTDLVCTEVDRIRNLVDRMESFTDTRRVEREPENIHAVLSHVRRVAEQGFASALTFRERYDPSLPPVLGNRDALIQVFLNLVKNAAEAVGEDGEIMMTTAYRHGLKVAVKGSERRVSVPLEVCVIDNGPGAPADMEEHLFDPFVTSKRSSQGLGLALVAKIIGEHGGIVEYERTQLPPRTIFRVLLPMQEARS